MSLHVHDARARLVNINERSAGAPLGFILAGTPRGNVWRFGTQLPAELARCLHAVAAWARAIRALGRIPLYSTSWDNTASRAVASKLEMQRYAVTFSVT